MKAPEGRQKRAMPKGGEQDMFAHSNIRRIPALLPGCAAYRIIDSTGCATRVCRCARGYIP